VGTIADPRQGSAIDPAVPLLWRRTLAASMRIGILTGGGDCPGLNAVIRGATVRLLEAGHEVVGLQYGWKGLLEKDTRPLTMADVEGIERTGGTILFTSRTNPYKDEETAARAKAAFQELGLDALIAVGGDDTLGACHRLTQAGVPAVGVPKTIDNDLSGTDYTFGFDTAVNIIMEALDRLHTTAASHSRILVVEVMGRYAGWMTLQGGLAGGAHAVLLPEEPFDLDELARLCKERRASGKHYTLIACSEGAVARQWEDMETQDAQLDEFGHVRLGGVAKSLARLLEEKTGQEARHVVLGHLQRGGAPSAFDRMTALRFGLRAAEAVMEGRFGTMTALRATEVELIPLEDAVTHLKTVPEHRVREKNHLAPLHPSPREAPVKA